MDKLLANKLSATGMVKYIVMSSRDFPNCNAFSDWFRERCSLYVIVQFPLNVLLFSTKLESAWIRRHCFATKDFLKIFIFAIFAFFTEIKKDGASFRISTQRHVHGLHS